MDFRVIHNFLNPFIIPAGCSGWVLVQEVAAIVQLHPVNTAHKVEMHNRFLPQSFDPQWVHLAVIHTLIPRAKKCAWRAPNNPGWFKLIDQGLGQLSVGSLTKVPWLAIGLGSSEVESMQTIEVQVSPLSMRGLDNGSMTIELKEGRLVLRSKARGLGRSTFNDFDRIRRGITS